MIEAAKPVSRIGLRKMLLWVAAVAFYSVLFRATASKIAANDIFNLIPEGFICLSWLLFVIALRTVLAPTLVGILSAIAGMVYWPVFFYTGVSQDIDIAAQLGGCLLGALFGYSVLLYCCIFSSASIVTPASLSGRSTSLTS